MKDGKKRNLLIGQTTADKMDRLKALFLLEKNRKETNESLLDFLLESELQKFDKDRK